MRITIALPAAPNGQDQGPLNIDLAPDMTQADLKAIIEADTSIPVSIQVLMFNNSLLQDDTKTLQDSGIQDGELLELQIWQTREPRRPQAQQSQSMSDVAEMLRLQALENPELMQRLHHDSPALADAVSDPRRFRDVWSRMKREQNEAEAEKERNIALLNANPMDIEAQKKIEEMIRQEAVMQNLQSAFENTPEAFGRVHMLYIPVEVNGVPVKAFVDSGAQATIMSPSCAEKCGIMRLLDKNFAGIARGVGTANILGRVHSAQIKIGSLFLPCSFTVMEGKDVDLLLGLDMLKRHQACIDLRKNALVIMDNEVSFLGEADIPKNEFPEEPTVQGPAGLQIGAKTGALMPSGAEQGGPSSAALPTQTTEPQQHPQAVSPQQGASSTQQAASQSTGANQALHAQQTQKIAQLMDLGFSREEVIRALRRAQGNVDIAAGILYQ